MASYNLGQTATAPKILVQRSLSFENADVCNAQDREHSSSLLLGLFNQLNDERFCDVTLVFGPKEIKAHKVVLASSSRYFEVMFSSHFIDSTQQRLEIPVLDANTGAALIEFAYTGKINITCDNVVDLLAGANFLQGFEFVEKSCCDYLISNKNGKNALEILEIADQFHQCELKKSLENYCLWNFSSIDNDAFLNIPAKLLIELLSDNNLLVVNNGEVLLGRKQEEVLLQKVLEYIKHKEEAQVELNVHLEEILKCIRLPLLKKKSLKLLKSINALQSPECSALINKAVLSKKKKDKHSEGECDDWAKARPCGEYQLWRGRCLADGNLFDDEDGAFFDKDKINVENDFVMGMDLWICQWNGRPVLGGIKIYYSNGESCLNGSNKGETKEEFRLDPDERIAKVDSQSNFMVDNLAFYTTKGKKHGPYGGNGGSFRHEVPPGCHGYLAFVNGTVAKCQGNTGIRKLQFVWRFLRLPGQKPEPDYVKPVVEVFGSFDELDGYDCSDDFDDYDDYADDFDDFYNADDFDDFYPDSHDSHDWM